jgi:hypothetical protein
MSNLVVFGIAAAIFLGAELFYWLRDGDGARLGDRSSGMLLLPGTEEGDEGMSASARGAQGIDRRVD